MTMKNISNTFIWIFKMILWLFQPFVHILLSPLLYFITSNFCFVPHSSKQIGITNRFLVFVKWVLDFIILFAFYVIGWYTINGSWIDLFFEGIYGLFGDQWLFGIPQLIVCIGLSFVSGTMFLCFLIGFYDIIKGAINEFCGTEHTTIQEGQIKKLFIYSIVVIYIPLENIYKTGIQKPVLYLIHLMVLVLVFIYIDGVVISQFQEYHKIPRGIITSNEIIYTKGEFPPNYFLCFFALLSLLLSIFWVIFSRHESSKRVNTNH